MLYSRYLLRCMFFLASCIGILKRSRPFVPFETLLCSYKTLVQPHFDYCTVVLGNCNKSLSSKLQKLQNRTTRILTSSYDASADNLLIKLGWQKLNRLRELKAAAIIYKSLNALAPDYLKSMCADRSAIPTYSLRNGYPTPPHQFSKKQFQLWWCSAVEQPDIISVSFCDLGVERFTQHLSSCCGAICFKIF